MDGRRALLKAGLVAIGNLLVAPARMLLGAVTSKAPARRAHILPSEEKIVRSYYEDGWNRGDKPHLLSISRYGEQSARELDRYRGAFPDLRFDVLSVQKVGDEIHVRWTAQGTNRGALDGRAATGRRAMIQGTTKFKVVDGKIVSAVPEWDQAALHRQLGAQGPG